MAGSSWLNRTVLTVAVASLVGLLLGAGVGFYLATTTKPFYRAEMELALLPAASVQAEFISNYWEVLARGQAPRVAAEVLNQPRWREQAAAAAGVDRASVSLDAGVVTDTTLITVGVGAPSGVGAERGVKAAVEAATTLAQEVSGPFELRVVQPAEGTAKLITTPGSQVIAIAGLAGLAVGAGAGLLWLRRRKPAAPARPAPRAQSPRPAAPRPRPMEQGQPQGQPQQGQPQPVQPRLPR